MIRINFVCIHVMDGKVLTVNIVFVLLDCIYCYSFLKDNFVGFELVTLVLRSYTKAQSILYA